MSNTPCQWSRSHPDQRPPCVVKVLAFKTRAVVKADAVEKTCICLINTRSVRKKTTSLLELLADFEADIRVITET